jgi:hypothetical protein
MAEVELRAGAHIDFLTKEEMADETSRLIDFFTEFTRGQEGETVMRSAGPFLTDSTGGTSTLGPGGGVVYVVPTGFDAYLLRCSVDFGASNANSPTACDIRIVADQNTPAGLRALNNSVPTVYRCGRSDAILFRSGQRIVVCLTGGPASTSIYCTVQVLLTRRKALRIDTLESA